MHVIKNDKTLYVDVDESLISFELGKSTPIHIKTDAIDAYVAVLNKNVAHIYKHKARGHEVFLWSHGGVKWAEAVAKALGLEDVVDYVMAKPCWFIDDLPANEFMPEGNRIYFHE